MAMPQELVFILKELPARLQTLSEDSDEMQPFFTSCAEQPLRGLSDEEVKTFFATFDHMAGLVPEITEESRIDRFPPTLLTIDGRLIASIDDDWMTS